MVRSPFTGGWLRRFHSSPAEPTTRLVCLPHAGGSASSFFQLSAAAPDSVEVLCVQYPGRQDRLGERCVDRVDELADRILESLGPWLDRPVALFGHSLGATVGFEVAHRLEADGVVPRHFFASSSRAPSRWRQDGIHLLPDADLVAELLQLGGTDRDVFDDHDLVRLTLPAIRADYRAAETYRPKPLPALSGSMSVLIGDRDTRVTPGEARAWRQYTVGSCAFYQFPGGHFYVQEQLPAVIELIAQRLRPSGAGRGRSGCVRPSPPSPPADQRGDSP